MNKENMSKESLMDKLQQVLGGIGLRRRGCARLACFPKRKESVSCPSDWPQM